ncbi:omptin family outer membrane protease [Thiohalophilus sp.]|uniref:omptin family outer membrane protease n=1 Tax=Thiohalophilus sp. TaxID=3028392 RepID=UPI002ACD76D8|nr:omptin family outer membrane protease [Thiohalophilus sp.]MDZ7661336.1 omptin family outer membrane protease [Thiohalophilus sp.]MDZ7803095.1 omptin family outer membrane protease [Thiohalophilus sp.]
MFLQPFSIRTGVFLLAGLIIVPAQAQLFDERANWASRDRQAEAYVSAGVAQGKANELVYGQPSSWPTDYKLSQLIWETRQLPMLSAGVSARFGLVTLNLQGRLGITAGDAVMDDYDWVYTNRDWSHWSHHEDTDVTEAWAWDISLDFELTGSESMELAGVLGYKQELWAWESYGGSYIYSSSGNFRDDSGSFTPGQPVISYEQRFRVPYIGLRFTGETLNWRFGARYLYSNQVDVAAIDHHYLRDLIFEDSFSPGEMSSYEISIEYRLSRQLGLLARYDVQDYAEVRGDTLYRDSNTGAVTGYCTNCAGADNRSELVSVGLSYRF